MARGPQNTNLPTGILYVPLDTDVSVGCTVTGSGIQSGTEVTSVLQHADGYLVIALNQLPWTSSVPAEVIDEGFDSTSPLTGLTLGYTSTFTFTCIASQYFEDFVVGINETYAKTLSFKEDVKGWVSFKSFTPENAISMANDYYTFFNGNLYKHHIELGDRNTFYAADDSIVDPFTSSSVNVVLNDSPSAIKEFNTLNYEGSQSKVERFTFHEGAANPIPFQPNTDYSDQEYYNLSAKDGWYTEFITTNEENGYIDEFLNKEDKWFNYIKRKIDLDLIEADTGDFSFQGIGFAGNITSDIEDGGISTSTGGGISTSTGGGVNDEGEGNGGESSEEENNGTFVGAGEYGE